MKPMAPNGFPLGASFDFRMDQLISGSKMFVRRQRRRALAAASIPCLFLALAVCLPIRGQELKPTPSRVMVHGIEIIGVPDDSSSRHVVFSDPGTEEQAIAKGKHEEWLRVVNDPRYVIQQLRRHATVRGPAAVQVAVSEASRARTPKKRPKPVIHKDWSEGLGTFTSYYADIYGNYPAKWSFSAATANCASDFVVLPAVYPASSTQATLVAYSNLYSGCGGAVPSVYWAYYTGDVIDFSPVLSADGSQVAVIQSDSNTGSSSLAVIKWAASTAQTVTAPGTPTSVAPASYPGCTAPCMTSVVFSGNDSDQYSDPYYDYGSDTLYVGGGSGSLHKFTPVFTGPPAEVTSSGWPVNLATGNPPAGPVYDSISGCVFVGNAGTGRFYSVNSGNPGTQCTAASGSVYATSAEIGSVVDAPLLDSAAGTVYAFAALPGTLPFEYSRQVAQFPVSFSGSSYTPSLVPVDTVQCPGCGFFLAGAFDNVYYESSSPASPSGHLYFAGWSNLYQLTIANNMMGALVTGPALGQAGSNVTEFCNNQTAACESDGVNTTAGTDYIFLSSEYASFAPCTNTSGCVMSFTVTTPSAFTSSSQPNSPLSIPFYADNLPPAGAISIDNSLGSGTLAGASQIYFLTYGSGTCGNGATAPCATQASQSAP